MIISQQQLKYGAASHKVILCLQNIYIIIRGVMVHVFVLKMFSVGLLIRYFDVARDRCIEALEQHRARSPLHLYY